MSGKGVRPSNIIEQLTGICMSLLLASMALYGAVQLVQAIWVPLCIVLGVVVVIGAGIAAFLAYVRRWH